MTAHQRVPKEPPPRTAHPHREPRTMPLTAYASRRILGKMVEVIVSDEFKAWYEDLSEGHQDSVFHVVGLLEGRGTTLGFPYSSDLKGTKHALRELCIKAQGAQIRVAYAFDPARNAVLLLGGDKTGDDRFYEWLIPAADKIWVRYLAEHGAEKRGDK